METASGKETIIVLRRLIAYSERIFQDFESSGIIDGAGKKQSSSCISCERWKSWKKEKQ
jgi:hypothetical protein